MVRRPVFAAAWAAILSACALDMGGLGVDDEDGGSGATPASFEAAAGEQSVAQPQSVDGSGGGPEAPTVDAQGSAADTSTSTSDAPATSDASAGDAHGEAGTPCDQDGDGYLAMGAACGGNDCCDQDAHVHPGDTAYFTTPGACGGYDYNCDGKETEEYGAENCEWSTFSCSGDGFAAPIPSCGATGTYTSCSIPWYDVFSCTGSNGQQTQACR
jgi:hypothetical protein